MDNRTTLLLAGLPVREQRILVLRFAHDMSQTEIAAEVGLSQMHVSRLLVKCLARLHEGLVGEVPPSGGQATPAGGSAHRALRRRPRWHPLPGAAGVAA